MIRTENRQGALIYQSIPDTGPDKTCVHIDAKGHTLRNSAGQLDKSKRTGVERL